MEQKGVSSPEEHTRCLHPFLATWDEKDWGWGLTSTSHFSTPHPSPAHSCLLPSVQPHFCSCPQPLPASTPHPSPPASTPHLLTEMPDAPDLEGASGLHILTLEEDSRARHLGQCPALQQRCDHVEVLALSMLCQRALHSSNRRADLLEHTDVTGQQLQARVPLTRTGEGPWGSPSAWLP